MGDRVLAAVGIAAKTMDGAVGRLGGEEFCVLAFGEVADAAECASELQRSIRALRFSTSARSSRSPAALELRNGRQMTRWMECFVAPTSRCTKLRNPAPDRIALSDTYALSSEHDNWPAAGWPEAGCKVRELDRVSSADFCGNCWGTCGLAQRLRPEVAGPMTGSGVIRSLTRSVQYASLLRADVAYLPVADLPCVARRFWRIGR